MDLRSVLVVKASIMGDQSTSGRVADTLAGAIREGRPGLDVEVLDLGREPVPHVDLDFVHARGPSGASTAGQRAARDLADRLVDQVCAADLLIIATPVHNLGVPSVLKAWMDRIVQRGRTVEIGPNGPVGKLGDKRMVIVVASAGVYSTGPMATHEHHVAYLKDMFRMLGLVKVEVLRLEGLARPGEDAEAAVAGAQEAARRLAAEMLAESGASSPAADAR